LRIVSDRHAPDVARVPPPPASSIPDVRLKRTTPTTGRTSPTAAPFTSLAKNLETLLTRGPDNALAVEQTLADLVRAAREDRTSLRAALIPIAEGGFPPRLRHDLPLATPLRQLHEFTLNLAHAPARPRPQARRVDLSRLFQRLSLPLDRPPGMDPYALRGPADILTLRLAELAARTGDPGAVELVSTPTQAEGWIDSGVLCARIAEAEEAGWQPWPLDLDQALLRLPEAPDVSTVRAAHRLASPAGHRLAGWLRGGRPTIPTAKASSAAQAQMPAWTEARTKTQAQQEQDREREQALAHTSRPLSRRIEPLAGLPWPSAAPHVPTTLIHLLRRGWYAPLPVADGSCWTVCWPALLPDHADLIGVALECHVGHVHHGCRPAALAPIARAITSRSPTERSGAAQAVTALAASGHLDGDEFGRALVRYATRLDRQVLRSAVLVLQQALQSPSAAPENATNEAGRSIGAAILHWLPAVLPPAVPQPLPYTSHLLNLAADAVATTRAEAPADAIAATDGTDATISSLAALAARPARSAVSDAAQRLLAAMTT